MRRFYEQTLCILQKFLLTNPDLHHGLLTAQLHPKLFSDFDADSCIVIYDLHKFAQRVFVAARQILPAFEWHGVCRSVRYFDPYFPPSGSDPSFDPFTSKHFRYAYQNEVRFTWLPETLARPLAPELYLELGDISDICQLIKK